MSAKVQSNKRLRDMITVLEGIQRVAYVASKQNGEALGDTWKKYSKSKPFDNVMEDPRKLLLRSKNISNIDPLELTRRAIFIGENLITFSSAASNKVYRRLTSQYHQEMYKKYSKDASPSSIRDTDFMDDAQYDECDDEYVTEEIEYTISPDKSSLGLIKSVEDFTDRNKIFSAMFMASPKSRYRSEFTPRKFAVPSTEIKNQPLCSDTISISSDQEKEVLTQLHKLDKLSSTARARHVPSSRVSRLANFSSLGIGLGLGTVAEASRRIVSFGNQHAPTGSVLLSEANVDRIVSTLCGVRGAALKIGQMLSIQDESMVNPEVSKLFQRVRQSADYMPETQLQNVLIKEFGPNWQSDNFKEFNMKPFAAASIGQVHLAVLKDDRRVAVKVQYPGVAKGIESDIKNLMGLLKVINILPEGLFMDNIIKHMTIELKQECDYEREAHCCTKMKMILESYPKYYVPAVIPELSTKEVITCEYIEGLTIDECADMLDQETRNEICRKFVELMLRELFIHRYMQTDPNWANFLYNPKTGKLGLLDFGATREWNKSFVDTYFKIIQGGANGDRKQVLDNSVKLGFLTGYENNDMNEAHVTSVIILSEAFRENKPYNFATQNATLRMQELVPIMLKNRLCPPPPEIYSLHRKMSGMFLMASKLKAEIDCSKIYRKVEAEYIELSVNS